MAATDPAARFRLLHEQPGCFVLPNPWDAGSARLLASFGFQALATTSAGAAFSAGVRDGALSRDAALEHCRDVVAATDLPVSADLSDGFGATPDAVADTVRRACALGLAGCSVEDHDPTGATPIRDFEDAVARIAAAVAAARADGGAFVLTARAENYLYGRPDLDDTIRRLQAFERAGADVLYAPGLPDLDAIRAVVAEVSKPVNVVIGAASAGFDLPTLAAAGVKRVSLGSSLYRAAIAPLLRAAQAITTDGDFSFAADAAGFAEIEQRLSGASTPAKA